MVDFKQQIKESINNINLIVDIDPKQSVLDPEMRKAKFQSLHNSKIEELTDNLLIIQQNLTSMEKNLTSSHKNQDRLYHQQSQALIDDFSKELLEQIKEREIEDPKLTAKLTQLEATIAPQDIDKAYNPSHKLEQSVKILQENSPKIAEVGNKIKLFADRKTNGEQLSKSEHKEFIGLKKEYNKILNNLSKQLSSNEVEKPNEIIKNITNKVDKITDQMSKTQTNLKNLANEISSKIDNQLAGMADNIKDVAKDVVNQIDNTQANLKNVANKVVNKIDNQVAGVADNIKDVAKDVVNQIDNTQTNLKNVANKVVNKIDNQVAGVADNIKDKVNTPVKNGINGLIDKLEKGLNRIINSELITKLVTKLEEKSNKNIPQEQQLEFSKTAKQNKEKPQQQLNQSLATKNNIEKSNLTEPSKNKVDIIKTDYEGIKTHQEAINKFQKTANKGQPFILESTIEKDGIKIMTFNDPSEPNNINKNVTYQISQDGKLSIIAGKETNCIIPPTSIVSKEGKEVGFEILEVNDGKFKQALVQGQANDNQVKLFELNGNNKKQPVSRVELSAREEVVKTNLESLKTAKQNTDQVSSVVNNAKINSNERERSL